MDNSKHETSSAERDRALRFAKNVSRLMAVKRAERGENIHQFAKRIGLPYGWLRRISTAGVSQTNRRTLPMLERLAEELGVSSYTVLWEEIPNEIDGDEFVSTLKRNHPREWALFVAWKWSKADTTNQFFKSGEEDAELTIKSSLFRWQRENGNPPVTVEEIAAEFAQLIDDWYVIVRRDQKAESTGG